MFNFTISYFIPLVLLLSRIAFAQAQPLKQVNVLDYGAIANDGKDDLVAFNQALQALGQSDAARKVLTSPGGVTTCFLSMQPRRFAI